MSHQEILETLLEALECHVDRLDSSSILALIGVAGSYCTAKEAALISNNYAQRLMNRIPIDTQALWNLDDIPTTVSIGIARMLYAFMGDIDHRIRWRAAHAWRLMVSLGETDILAQMSELYQRTSEVSYRQPNIPFYWLAARLWLIITLNRLASEAPKIIAPYALWLLDIATNNEFPHVLIQAFAKSTIDRLIKSGNIVLDNDQQDALRNVNQSRIGYQTPQDTQRAEIGLSNTGQKQQRRFHFDSMDTLPYWYSSPIKLFANVSQEKFLTTAERWIVDQWGVQDSFREWKKEPHRHRDPEGSLLSLDHRHGSLPILERFHTYLEWHAMWCTVGDLLHTYPLAQEADINETLEDWIRRHDLTNPPLWLADLRGGKPLEDRFWFEPEGDINTWINTIDNETFLAELGILYINDMIVVDSHYETRSRNFYLSTRVATALVSPDTARALARALQSIDDSWNYLLPPEGDYREIHASPYVLVGWLTNETSDLGIDEGDPLRYEIGAITACPSSKTQRILNLEFTYDGQAHWIDSESKVIVFYYEAWSDNHGDEEDERFGYDENARSQGSRLKITKKALQTLLKEENLDLIVEVEIIRRNKGYGRYTHDEEKAQEERYDRVLILRGDGTIESAEGRLGTWMLPSS